LNLSNYATNLSTNIASVNSNFLSYGLINSTNASFVNVSVGSLVIGGTPYSSSAVGPNVSFTNASVISFFTNSTQPFAASDSITLYNTATGNITIGSNTATVNIGSSGTGATLNVYGPISGSTLTSTSDYRLKENVEYNISTDISLLKPCYYNFINTSDHKFGFIAHEVQEVIPQAVIGKKDAVDHDSIVPQRIDYSAITAASVHAIQKLMKIVEGLEERIRVLESKP
jgi:hypothetical protein